LISFLSTVCALVRLNATRTFMLCAMMQSPLPPSHRSMPPHNQPTLGRAGLALGSHLSHPEADKFAGSRVIDPGNPLQHAPRRLVVRWYVQVHKTVQCTTMWCRVHAQCLCRTTDRPVQVRYICAVRANRLRGNRDREIIPLPNYQWCHSPSCRPCSSLRANSLFRRSKRGDTG
jgi:hypothetical protein